MRTRFWWLPIWLTSPATLLFLGVLCLAVLLRFYNLTGSLMFLGDQGRDALVVSRMFLNHDLAFIGPVTSVGNMYLGPLYYYFMLPWLFLSYPSPVGPAAAVAVVSCAAIILLYRETKRVFGTSTAILSSVFFAFSSTIVTYSRFSWNPNLEPFLSILLLFSLLRFWQDRSFRQLAWIALTVAGLLQLHYTTLLVVPVVGLVWLCAAIGIGKKKLQQKQFLYWSMVAVGIVLVSFVPLILFDWKHAGLNFRGAVALFQSDSFHAVTPWWQRLQQIVKETHGRGMHIFFEVQIGKNRVLNSWLLSATVASVGWLLWRLRGRQRALLQLLVLFLATAIFGLSFYTSSVFDHYILFAIPFACMVFGIVLGQVWQSRFSFGKVLVVVIVLAFFAYNWSRYPLATAGLNTAFIRQTTDEIHRLILPGEKYNILLLSATRDSYGQNYRYFLSTDPEKAPVQPELYQTAETLIIINEERIAADPLALPIYELVVFPSKSPVEVLELPHGPQLFVLRTDPSSV